VRHVAPALQMSVAAISELPRFIGVASGAGFPTYPGFSLENTPMHHRGVLAFSGLDNLLI
jgi:hypothetical protein